MLFNRNVKKQCKGHVFIVEENLSDSMFFYEILQKKGYTPKVITAKKIIIRANILSPKLFIISSNLKSKSSLELCRDIKKEERLKDIPILIVADKASSAEVIEYYKQMIDYIFIKPVSKKEFINKVNTLVGNDA